MHVVLLAVLLLFRAAPAGAALPEHVVHACESLHNVDAIFIGRPQLPVEVRVSFEDRIEPARQRWLKIQAEADRSTDIEPHKRAVDAHSEFDHLRAYYPPPANMVVIPVHVEARLKGEVAGTVYVNTIENEWLDPKRSYLFFGDYTMRPFDDRFMERQGARPVEDATWELRLINEALATSHGGLVVGSVEFEATSNLDSASGPVPGAGLTVRVASTGFALDTTTDVDGMFLVAAVPFGTVNVSPTLPNGWTVRHPSTAEKSHQRTCTVIQVRAALNGRIRGRVTGRDGKPRPDLPLQLYPRTSYESGLLGGSHQTRTNARGEFEFRAIPPGAYLLGHQIISPDFSFSGQPMPPKTFYPGTPDRAAAVPVVVGNATEHNGLDFVVVW